MQPKLKSLSSSRLCSGLHEKLLRPRWTTWHSFSQTHSGADRLSAAWGGSSLHRPPHHLLLLLLGLADRIGGGGGFSLWGSWTESWWAPCLKEQLQSNAAAPLNVYSMLYTNCINILHSQNQSSTAQSVSTATRARAGCCSGFSFSLNEDKLTLLLQQL